ncbi:MAG TPA: LptF/LptG family permease [Pyrinomonadaceae bacterium]|nr:LptF/LptG family permease [Pyrinomonadaceae bacterium]
MFKSRLIATSIIRGTLPYVLLSLFLLTAILFTQQSSRFAEIALYADVPIALAGRIAASLLPSVLVLTIPVAVLAGIMICLSRMGSDSEIVAIRAAGVGTWTLLWPVLLIGLLGTVATVFLHMKEAPQAARDLRRATVEGALRKLESPVAPRTFNTEIPGYVIYVREGDKQQGTWSRVFIFAQQPDGTRAVTARAGRIDSSEDKAELVLSDAVAMKIPSPESTDRSYVVERLAQLRIAIDTGRAAVLQRLSQREIKADELDWNDLRLQAKSESVDERREAERALHRRLALSVAPFVFALFGGLLGMRVRRGGRGAGVILSLGIVIVYYLISLLGESLARSNTLPPIVAQWMATAVLLLLSLVLFTVSSVSKFAVGARVAKVIKGGRGETDSLTQHTLGAGRSGFPSLLDTSLFRTLASSFAAGFLALVGIFVIFTLFELWRFIGANSVPASVVAKYILFMLPVVSVELFPAAMLITVLITYALLARRSEAIAWWASGQSVYRLMLPGLLFAIAAGAGLWLIQEHLMPQANIKQEVLRARIRGGQPRATTLTGRQWLASADSKQLYSYEFDDQRGVLIEPTIYELDSEGIHLGRVTTGKLGVWNANGEMMVKDAEVLNLQGMVVDRQMVADAKIPGADPPQVFKPTLDRPSQLSVVALSNYVRTARVRGVDVSALASALQRKYVNPFSVIVMAFIGMPLALAFGRKGALVAMCMAVGVSVLYWGMGGGFQQLGNYGLLPPEVAAWSPPVIFAALGTYFLSRVRT